jgi:predicted transcriptional regulator
MKTDDNATNSLKALARDRKVALANQLYHEEGLTQKAVGEALGVSQQTVGRWVNPEVAERNRGRNREQKRKRYWGNPEYREAQLERVREQSRRHRHEVVMPLHDEILRMFSLVDDRKAFAERILEMADKDSDVRNAIWLQDVDELISDALEEATE